MVKYYLDALNASGIDDDIKAIEREVLREDPILGSRVHLEY